MMSRWLHRTLILVILVSFLAPALGTLAAMGQGSRFPK
jgi:hypothetical protein